MLNCDHHKHHPPKPRRTGQWREKSLPRVLVSLLLIAAATAGAYFMWMDWEQQTTLEAAQKREDRGVVLSATADAKVASAIEALNRQRYQAARRLAGEAIGVAHRAASLAPDHQQVKATLSIALSAAQHVDITLANAVEELVGEAKIAARRHDFNLASLKLSRAHKMMPHASQITKMRAMLTSARADHLNRQEATRRREAEIKKQRTVSAFATSFVASCMKGGKRNRARCRCIFQQMTSTFEPREKHLLVAFLRSGRDHVHIRAVMNRFGREETIATVLRMRVLAARMSRTCPIAEAQ